MNICWFNHRCINNPDIGAVEEHLHQIVRRVIGRDPEVSVSCESAKGPSWSEIIEGIFVDLWGLAGGAHAETNAQGLYSFKVPECAYKVGVKGIVSPTGYYEASF